MADVTVVAAEVLPTSTTAYDDNARVYGEVVTAGQIVYLKESDDKYWLSDANSATAAIRGIRGVAMNSGAAGQRAVVAIGGDIDPGFTCAKGVHVLSATPGGIAPIADYTAGWYLHILGWATSATNFKLNIQNPDTLSF